MQNLEQIITTLTASIVVSIAVFMPLLQWLEKYEISQLIKSIKIFDRSANRVVIFFSLLIFGKYTIDKTENYSHYFKTRIGNLNK